ncbi:MAG: PDDEXK nuclease domain-containing protein [Paludibacteraceae bacterium]|nr:PDDEXK nuclease domain-containing protein [Paludibacteraceae bacterium]
MGTKKTILPTPLANSTNETYIYHDAVQTIKQAILEGQYEAAKGVNRIQLAVYFAIGKYISLHTRKDKWGTHALEFISAQLRRELPGLRGFSETQLREMRLFYEGWIMLDANSSVATDELQNADNECVLDLSVATDELIDVHHAITISDLDFPLEEFFKVPFTHHSRILANAKDSQTRYYYIHRVAEEHLSISQLKQLMKDEAHKHQGDMPNNFVKTISDTRSARKAVMMFKDEYLLNFINVEEIGEREQIDVDERVIEQKIIGNIKNFILTFGSDFAFIGNQYHLEAYGVEQFPDLLFFNRELNALVVIELKYGDFKTSYLGQLMGYLRIIDDHVRKPHENPTIGIVLCKSANKEFVEYVIQDYNKPMGVATYKTLDDMPESIRKALPNNEQLQQLLSPDSSL